MEEHFWHQRWAANNIAGFDQSDANPFLVEYFGQLDLAKGSRIFIPLCGKTIDISWLLANGYRVAGAELSKLAIDQLFAGLGVEPKIEQVEGVEHYSSEGLDIFVGNLFELSGQTLGPVDAIYDRAALVALPQEMRSRYTAHLTNITNRAPQLLICYEYDQQALEGPPFSIGSEELNRHYADNYALTLLSSAEVPGGLKAKCQANENVWLLS